MKIYTTKMQENTGKVVEIDVSRFVVGEAYRLKFNKCDVPEPVNGICIDATKQKASFLIFDKREDQVFPIELYAESDYNNLISDYDISRLYTLDEIHK